MLDHEHQHSIVSEVSLTQYMLRQLHVCLKPRIFKDGDMWCALLGDDMMIGVVAFGKTPKQAAEAWDLVWINGGAAIKAKE